MMEPFAFEPEARGRILDAVGDTDAGRRFLAEVEFLLSCRRAVVRLQRAK